MNTQEIIKERERLTGEKLTDPQEVKRGPGVDSHGNTIKNIPTPKGSAPRYIPTPTDAFTLLVGWDAQPANPYLLASDEEAKDIFQDLKTNCIGFPQDAILRDAPDCYPGPIFYGKDGRKVWAVEFFLPLPNSITPLGGVSKKFSESVGMLLFARAQYPDYKWKISFESGGIERNPTTGHV